MDWLIVLFLGGWCAFQQFQLNSVRARFDALLQEFQRFKETARRDLETPAPVTAPKAVPASFAKPLDEAPLGQPRREEQVIALAEPSDRVQSAPLPDAERPAAARPANRRSVSDWLSENGLAWIGGGALALGGLLLVAYAAEQGLFNPAFRICAATILGLLALAAGEALRRGVAGKLAPNGLVAALTTAAGAAMLYAATWAAYRLYGFIPAGAAALVLATISLGLLALALLHGEALGMLAIGAAYAVPLLSGGSDWSSAPLDGFILLILVTGLATTGLRRWTRGGVVTLVGAGLWALARLLASDRGGPGLLTALAPALTLVASMVARRVSPIRSATSDGFSLLLPAASIGASVFALLLWSNFTPDAAPYAALATAVIIISIALGVRATLTTPRLLIAPAAVCVIAAQVSTETAANSLHVLWILPCAAFLAAAGFDGAWRSDQRREAAVIGTAGAALTLTFSITSLSHAVGGWDWVIDAAFAVMLGGGATLLAGRAADPESDLPTAAWIAAAAEVTGLALYTSLDGRFGPTAYGLLAVALAVLSVRIRWRGFAESAAAACLASFAALLARPVAAAAITGDAGWLITAAVGCGATLPQIAAWRVLKARKEAVASVEAISTLATMSALLGAFLVLQTLNALKGGPVTLDEFTRASIRTLLFLAAGLMLSIRGAATPLGRARAPIFLAVGALHGIILEGLFLHPWWGMARGVVGPPVFDGLLLGLLAPALMLLEASRRLIRQTPSIAGAGFALSLLFFVIWLVTELRRLFHGPTLAGDFGYAETAAYAVAAMSVGFGLYAAGAKLRKLFAVGGWLAESLLGVAWAGLAIGVLVFADLATPWWGPLEGDLHAPLLLWLLYAVGIGLSAGLAFAARRSDRVPLAHAALVAAGIQLFVLLTLTVRFLFHGGAMRVELREASLETWTFSAVWALYGLAILAVGSARKDAPVRGLGLMILLGTTLKVFLFDMARLEGVIRAASFLALGLVLLVGALAARRFRGGEGPTDVL